MKKKTVALRNARHPLERTRDGREATFTPTWGDCRG